MFKRGISDPFTDKLLETEIWGKIADDKDLFFAIRNEYVNVYYRGCSIFNISHKNNEVRFETHYKYLLHPKLKSPYIKWDRETKRIEKAPEDFLIKNLDIDLLKKSASYYAGAEKIGVHKILKSNGNIIDVEIALSREAEAEQDQEEQIEPSRRSTDRIDFVALQGNGQIAKIVCFEAKRFDNKELRSAKGTEPPIFEQIGRYEATIAREKSHIEESYRQVCRNLQCLAPDRCDPLTVAVANGDIELVVDPDVRLVVFGYDTDQRDGKVWKEHEAKLKDRFKGFLLSKGDPKDLTNKISKYRPSASA